jgi:3',5'-cyclic AMP phosphodiesterase CpdA
LSVVRLLQFSDIHFGGENVAATQAAAAFAEANPCDLIILSGDLTQFGLRPEFEAASRWIATLPRPILATPGNHDTPYAGVIERITAPFGRYAATVGPPDQDEFRASGLVVRAANTARGIQIRLNWSKGEITARQAAEAIADLETAPAGALTVLVTHHPLVETPGGPMTGRVRGGPRAARRLTEARIDLLLSGHLHMPFAHPLAFGDRKTYAVGAGTLSVRERGTPPGFNVIDADAESIVVTAMGWAGSHFEALRTWALPRRSAEG